MTDRYVVVQFLAGSTRMPLISDGQYTAHVSYHGGHRGKDKEDSTTPRRKDAEKCAEENFLCGLR